MVACGRLKTKELNFKLLAVKVVVVAYERQSFTRGSKYSDLTENFWYFEKLVAEVVARVVSTVYDFFIPET